MTPQIKTLTLALFMAIPFAAKALPPLEQNERVRNEFFAAAVGNEIRKNCSSISARIFYVMRRVRELENYAKSLGYTDADIDALEDDDAAKARLRAMRDRYLQQNGVVAGDEESYCRLGRQEISRRSLIGVLIREN